MSNRGVEISCIKKAIYTIQILLSTNWSISTWKDVSITNCSRKAIKNTLLSPHRSQNCHHQKSLQISNSVEKRKLYYPLFGRNQISIVSMKNGMEDPQYLSTSCHMIQQSNSRECYPDKALIWKDTCSLMFIMAYLIASDMKQPNCPSTNEYVKNCGLYMWEYLLSHKMR